MPSANPTIAVAGRHTVDTELPPIAIPRNTAFPLWFATNDAEEPVERDRVDEAGEPRRAARPPPAPARPTPSDRSGVVMA